MDLVKVGDVKECRIIGLDVDRKRISLSCKTAGGTGQGAGFQGNRGGASAGDGARRVVVAKRADGTAPGGTASRSAVGHGTSTVAPTSRPSSRGNAQGNYSGKNEREDDGMTYNPFAELLKGKKK
jgi:uncharacterized protein